MIQRRFPTWPFEVGPNLARFQASRDRTMTSQRAGELLGVAGDCIGRVLSIHHPSEIIPRAAVEELCRTRPDDVWEWQRTYRTNAHPARHAVPILRVPSW